MGSLELDTTERLHFHFSLSCIGEGNGNPLQRGGGELGQPNLVETAAALSFHRLTGRVGDGNIKQHGPSVGGL